MNAVGNTDADNTIDAAEPPTELSKDELFHLLQNERRRLVLEFLQGSEEAISMREIAEQVAAWENETSVAALDSDERQRVYIALYQSHLPKLDAAGVLRYNQERGIVTRTPLADQLDAYLNIDPSTDSAGQSGEIAAGLPGVPTADGVSSAQSVVKHRWPVVTVVLVSGLLIVGQSIGLLSLSAPVLAGLVFCGFVAAFLTDRH